MTRFGAPRPVLVPVLLALVMVAATTLGIVANRRSLRDWAKLELIALRQTSGPQSVAALGIQSESDLKYVD